MSPPPPVSGHCDKPPRCAINRSAGECWCVCPLCIGSNGTALLAAAEARRQPLACPCGQDHSQDAGYGVALVLAARGHLTPMLVRSIHGSWLVPRIYVLCHDIPPNDLFALASHYGWPRLE